MSGFGVLAASRACNTQVWRIVNFGGMFSSCLAWRLDMKAYSMDLRRRALRMCDAGRTTSEVARALDVSESWLRLLKQRRREDKMIAPRPSGGRRHGYFEPEHLRRLEHWLKLRPDTTLESLLDRVKRDMALNCSLMAVCRAVKKLGWSLKKRRFERTNKIARTLSAGD